jgi:hypothetical protein
VRGADRRHPDGDERRPDVFGNTVVSTRSGERGISQPDPIGSRRRLGCLRCRSTPASTAISVATRSASGACTWLWHLPTGALFGDRRSWRQFLNDIDGNQVVFSGRRNGQLDIIIAVQRRLLPGPDRASTAGTPAVRCFSSTY